MSSVRRPCCAFVDSLAPRAATVAGTIAAAAAVACAISPEVLPKNDVFGRAWPRLSAAAAPLIPPDPTSSLL